MFRSPVHTQQPSLVSTCAKKRTSGSIKAGDLDMPSSNLATWPSLIHLVWDSGARRILDVGPGRGKAAMLLREYVGMNLVIDCVESEPRYLTAVHRALYDYIHIGDVCDLSDEFLADYDLVLMVDVIEHIEKKDALNLLDRIPGWVVICTPEFWFQNPEAAEYPSEMHRSLWTISDFGDRLEHDASQLGGVLVRLRPQNSMKYVAERWERAAQSNPNDAISPANENYEISGWKAAKRLADVLPASGDVRLLELGCGNGRVTVHLCHNYGRVIAADVSPTMLDLCGEAIRAYGLANCDGTLTDGVTFPGHLDITDVYSNCVFLHHMKSDVRKMFAAISTVLPSGGGFFFQLPCYEVGAHEPRDWTAVGVWSKKELTRAIKDAGLIPVEIHECPGELVMGSDMPDCHAALHIARKP